MAAPITQTWHIFLFYWGKMFKLNSNHEPVSHLILTNISKQANIKTLLKTSLAYGCHTIFVVGQRKFNFNCNEHEEEYDDTSNNDNNNYKINSCCGGDDNRNQSKKSAIPSSIKPYFHYIENIHDYEPYLLSNENGNNTTSITHHNSTHKIKIVQFDKLQTCVEYLHNHNISILGIEIDDAAIDVEDETLCFQQSISKLMMQQHDTVNTESMLQVAFMMGNEGQGMNEKQMSLCDGFIRIKQFGGGTASLNVGIAFSIVLHRFYEWSKRCEC